MRFVQHSTPRHLDQAVKKDEQLNVYFHVDLNTESINDNTLFLMNVDEQRTVEIEYEYKRKHLLVKPKKDLESKCHYKLTLVGGDAGVLDIIGRKMSESYQMEFYTASSEALQTPIITYPNDKSILQSSDLMIKLIDDDKAEFTRIQVSSSNKFDVIIHESEIYSGEWMTVFSGERKNYYIRAISHKGYESSDYSKIVQFFFDKEKKTLNHVIQSNSSSAEDKEIIDSINETLEEEASFEVKKVSPPEGSSHLSANQLEKIRIKLNQEPDDFSVDQFSCYVVSEKN